MFENLEPSGETAILFNTGWATYLGVLLVSIWGGLTSYMNNITKFTWAGLIAKLFSSSFAGVMIYWSCQYSGISGPLAGVLIGVGSHLGTPALISLAMRLKVVRNLLADPDRVDGK